MALDPGVIRSEEGAISMAVSPGLTNMEFVVECASHQPPNVQVDDSGAQTPMTQVTAPAPPTAGLYQDTVTMDSKGGHVITCFNGTTRARQRVFAGDFPAWDASNVADRRRDPIEDAAGIAATTSKLG
jgi:hypothetical protein